MKVRITLKDPDTMHDAVDDAIKLQQRPDGISADEWDDIAEDRAEDAKSKISHYWMEYGEYLQVEFDTDAMTATVIPLRTPVAKAGR